MDPMSRFFVVLIALLSTLPLIATELNPVKPDNKPGQSDGKEPPGRALDLTKLPPHVRERLAALPPDEREKFLQNMRHWESLSDEERKRMKEFGRQESKRMREEMDALANAMGLANDSEVRKHFETRYREERRKVEKAVIEQLRAIRKPLLDAMHADLKREFSPATPAPMPTAAPAAASTP